jgi:FtsZ-binding cell division protein ZapB
MEEYTKTELKKKIEAAEEAINNLDLQIEDLKKQRSAIQDEKRGYFRNLNKLEADEFRQKHGKDKPFEEIESPNSLPTDIHGEFYELKDRIRCGCLGDPIDGCRGCSHNCHDIAKAKFEEKYNIKVHCL